MTSSWRAAAIASAVVCCAIGALPAGAQIPAELTNPEIEISYAPPTNPDLVATYERLRSRNVLEVLAQFLAPLKLPRKLTVKLDQCERNSVRYEPKGPVTICYEYVEEVRRLAPRSAVKLVQGQITTESAIVGPFVQAALHETAIGLFDVLSVPVWGRQDDAADRVAAFIMLQFGPKVAWGTIVGTAWFLSGGTSNPADFADVRGLVAQRYYTTLCMAYGSEQRQQFERFVGRTAAGNLPPDRAANCADEYGALRRGFNATIMPHVDEALLGKVRSVDWLKVLKMEGG